MTSVEEGLYAINREDTAALTESYKATDDETKAQLDQQTLAADSSKTKESRCTTRTKLFSVGLLAIAVAAAVWDTISAFPKKLLPNLNSPTSE